MFKKILIPTDGSPLSAQAANAGVSFARSVNAEIVALHVTQPFAATIGFDGMAAAYAITDDAYEKASAEQAAKYLDAVTSRADTAGVKSTALSVSNFNVADGIVQAAAETGCDLIFIGSHGRSGLSRLLLGSVTAKVLSLAHVAVLVYRVKEEKKKEKEKEKTED
ncbi:universal stress protein [Pigmentiphaga sp.]|uniref:universal stress protein n=1 Tax=Pigmentiphaga sp. TaxID=1977564 RepID=UPI0025D45EC1|nr:universal stress protein [Pigmentiphaga sp.]MBX6319599.1 universal stress protein [Pigmentiphaga sp.]